MKLPTMASYISRIKPKHGPVTRPLSPLVTSCEVFSPAPRVFKLHLSSFRSLNTECFLSQDLCTCREPWSLYLDLHQHTHHHHHHQSGLSHPTLTLFSQRNSKTWVVTLELHVWFTSPEAKGDPFWTCCVWEAPEILKELPNTQVTMWVRRDICTQNKGLDFST